MKKRLLIYSPANYRNVELQSQAELFIRKGFEVYLLTWLEEGLLHENFRELGAKAFAADKVKGRNIFFLINQSRFLSKFCKEHKIDYVISHSQGNAFVSGLARRNIKAKIYYFRHNSDYYMLSMPRKYRWANRWANRLSRYIIAPSRKVKEQLIKEGVDESKIYRINNCYNFSHYWKDTKHAEKAIREQYKCDLFLLMVSRLEPLKRHKESFEVVKALNEKGIDCKLVSIGNGSNQDELEKWIADNKMGNKIFLEPFRTNAIDYFQACDLLIHLSYSEASANVTKEAAMCDKTVVVCHDVGDFDDYMVHDVNAFLVDKENPVPETIEVLLANYKNKDHLDSMGKALHAKVDEIFSIESVEKDYEHMMNE
jgi:glycosyltransferase involved in cell wall biosynthesis